MVKCPQQNKRIKISILPKKAIYSPEGGTYGQKERQDYRNQEVMGETNLATIEQVGIDPNDGKMYKCKITFHAADGRRYPTDTLEMRGEIGLGIGRSQFWRKSNRTEASGLR
jgi:uncharacterized protein (DUF2147 family)